MRVDTIEKFKGLSVVYAIPTGNNKRNSKEGNIYTFEVLSIGRKYVELKLPSSRYSRKYLPKSGATQDDIKAGYGCNAGYMFFDSLEAIEEYSQRVAKISEINSFFRYGNDTSDLNDDDINTIVEIVRRVKND